MNIYPYTGWKERCPTLIGAKGRRTFEACGYICQINIIPSIVCRKQNTGSTCRTLRTYRFFINFSSIIQRMELSGRKATIMRIGGIRGTRRSFPSQRSQQIMRTFECMRVWKESLGIPIHIIAAIYIKISGLTCIFFIRTITGYCCIVRKRIYKFLTTGVFATNAELSSHSPWWCQIPIQIQIISYFIICIPIIAG